MQALRSALGLGLSFVPVPALQPAFELLFMIWDNVQKASRNKPLLVELARSCGNILESANEVLKDREGQLDDHVGKRLKDLNDLMKEFLEFTEKHANMNAFMALLKNSDVEGEIQSFQHRMHWLWMGFDMAAFNVLDASQRHIQEQIEKLLLEKNSRKRTLSITKPSIYGVLSSSPSKTAAADKPARSAGNLTKITEIEENKPIMAEASFDKPSRISLDKGEPIIATKHGENPFNLAQWGMKVAGASIVDASGGFNIVIPNFPKVSEWRLWGKTVSLNVVDPEHKEHENSIDIVFGSFTVASSWFVYLREYATHGSSKQRVSGQDVLVRRRFHCWIKRTRENILRRDPPHKDWYSRLHGHAGSARIYPTHLSYVTAGTLPFAIVYRSGSTIVREHYEKMQDDSSVTTSRTRFGSEEEATAWYEAYKNIVSGSHMEGFPVRVEFSNTYTAVLEKNFDGKIGLMSRVWPFVLLNEWGISGEKQSTLKKRHNGFSISNGTASWSWQLIRDRITIYTTLALQPDWYDNLELQYSDSQVSARWFELFSEIASGHKGSAVNPPMNIPLTVRRRSIIWLTQSKGKVCTREAFGSQWRAILGSTFFRYEYEGPYSFSGTSTVKGMPKLNVSTDGRTLVMKRDPGPGVGGHWVTRNYTFSSEDDAEEWYESCRQDAMQSSVQPMKVVHTG